MVGDCGPRRLPATREADWPHRAPSRQRWRRGREEGGEDGEPPPGSHVVQCTAGHPWAVREPDGRIRWEFASNLRVGDRLDPEPGAPAQVVLTIERRQEVARTFNFEVEGWHTYYVAGPQGQPGVLVHNVSKNILRLKRMRRLENRLARELAPAAGQRAADIAWKGFPAGSLAEHFGKHGAEFGATTVAAYRQAAMNFAREQGRHIQEVLVGNTLIKFDRRTGRVLIGHAADREFRTFYKAYKNNRFPLLRAVDETLRMMGRL